MSLVITEDVAKSWLMRAQKAEARVAECEALLEDIIRLCISEERNMLDKIESVALTVRVLDSVSPIQQPKFEEKTMSNEIPRRARIDLFTPAEKAIYDAVQVVESAGCDVRLTHAVNKLAEARALVADFVDGVPFGEGYPRVVSGAGVAGMPTPEMIAAMTPQERNAFVASAPQNYVNTTAGTVAVGYVPPIAGKP